MADKFFDIQKLPPTEEAIKAVRKREITKASVAFGIGLVMLFLSYFMGQAYWAVATLCSVLAGIVCIAFGGAFMADLDPYYRVPSVLCKDLFEACQRTPEGQQYRKEVILQGREFVRAEYYALKNWADSFEVRTECKKLYDIAQ